ncbi:hypothetical protein H0266_15725 [Halobacillus locisalis]|uniref:Glucosamine inositolphosphorylceramide transferase 1 N-terminal domain-containing protein n=1 Tax=Halobacillus locisalis TaxID=220753 RepID=A0A838CXL3_9BACI|nr:hypothetical protein [Halobacillus locisalis]MBA2176346.1 hypothetical protein [Halobacillus locisalis]
MNRSTITFGVLIEDVAMPKWQAEMIDHLIASPHVDVHYLMTIRGKKSVSETASWGGVPWVSGTVVTDVHLTNDTMKWLKEHPVDVLLSLGKWRWQGAIIDFPAYGVWGFRHQWEKVPFFQHYRERNSESEVMLARLFHDEDYQSLKVGYRHMHPFSRRRHQRAMEEGVVEWPAQAAKDILINGYPDSIVVSTVYDDPKVADRLHVVLSQTKHLGKEVLKKAFAYEYWNVGFSNQDLSSISQEGVSLRFLKEGKHHYYADPFFYNDGENWRIIAEEMDHHEPNGFISEWVMRDGDEPTEYKRTLSQPHHMSYPYIVHHDGTTYCIPETSEAKSVVLYQWSGHWKVVKTMLHDFAAVDATVTYYDDQWWMFCTKASGGNSHNEELHVFYADDLLGDWKEHPLNPVKVDVRSSRSAGTPFVMEESLYRPSQDCSRTYGGAVVINRIVALSSEQFREEPAYRLEPDPLSDYPDGLHTVSFVNGVALMDGKRIEYHGKHLLRKIHRFLLARAKRMKKREQTLKEKPSDAFFS